MDEDEKLHRLIEAIKCIADRHGETKAGSQILHVPVMPCEMKELRSALEPFRARKR